nr:hypothetical protein Iba_chr06aCG15360 [Ipomoea batatas]
MKPPSVQRPGKLAHGQSCLLFSLWKLSVSPWYPDFVARRIKFAFTTGHGLKGLSLLKKSGCKECKRSSPPSIRVVGSERRALKETRPLTDCTLSNRTGACRPSALHGELPMISLGATCHPPVATNQPIKIPTKADQSTA